MFRSVEFAKQVGIDPPAGPDTVIKAMFSQKLDFEPGERYAYSNFGYCLLGRVIEKLSGQPYDVYVKEKVLAPVGVTTMRIGATHLDGRAQNEVRYYQHDVGTSVFAKDLGQEVPWPYGGWYLEAMDSHGGWIASASDLAKFASAFDDPDHSPLLKRETIEAMYERPPGLAGHLDDGKTREPYYSLGWLNRTVSGGVNHWHTGSLSGTATIMVRRCDGRNYVALLNTRVSPTSPHLGRAIDELMHRAVDSLNAGN
jgi:N-acyl-D-amino-acid deacylase